MSKDSTKTKSLLLKGLLSDPSSPLDGQMSYNATTNKFRFRENGVWKELGAGGGGSGEAIEKQFTQNAHGFVVGDILRRTLGSYVKAQANSAANAEVVGIVSEVVDIDNFKIVTHGYITGLVGLTDGSAYFLSNITPGLITNTEPVSSGSISKPIGVAVSSTVLLMIIQRGYVNP